MTADADVEARVLQLLEPLVDQLTAAQPQLTKIFGSLQTACSQYAKGSSEANTVQFERVTIRLPVEVRKVIWGEIATSVESVCPLRRAPSVEPLESVRDISISSSQGRIGYIYTDSSSALEDNCSVANWVCQNSHQLRKQSPSEENLKAQMQLTDIVLLPDAFLCLEKHAPRDVGLLAAHDYGYVLAEHPADGYRVFSRPANAVVYNKVNAQRRKLFESSMMFTDPFFHFLGLYHVLEHAYFSGQIAKVHAQVSAGQLASARALWNKGRNEQGLLQSLFDELVWPGMDPNKLGIVKYPPVGDPIYAQLGFKRNFAVDQANYKTTFPRLIYAARCGVVHTKSDEIYLERTPDIVAFMRDSLIPDTRAVARQLVEDD